MKKQIQKIGALPTVPQRSCEEPRIQSRFPATHLVIPEAKPSSLGGDTEVGSSTLGTTWFALTLSSNQDSKGSVLTRLDLTPPLRLYPKRGQQETSCRQCGRPTSHPQRSPGQGWSAVQAGLCLPLLCSCRTRPLKVMGAIELVNFRH